MAGDQQTGICRDVARIAVPPLIVLGDTDKAWLGEAAAEVVAARLSQAEATSVLERAELKRIIEELEKNRGEASASVVGAGKLLGARLLVTGKLFPSGSGNYKGIIKAVETETGVWQPAIEFDASPSAWSEAVAQAAERLIATLGSKAVSNVPAQPLDDTRLELAAKGLELQSKGKLLEAQLFYSRALPAPTSAWRYEAAYLALMADLGMTDWVKDRGDKLLSAMPRTAANSCDRARVLVERHRGRGAETVSGVREAVRVAASCGDAAVIVDSLTQYGWKMRGVHAPSAARAAKLASEFAPRGGAQAECNAAFQRHYLDHHDIMTNYGTESWLEAAKRCTAAGDLRSAGLLYINAAGQANSGVEKLELRGRALKVMRQVGGSRLDHAYVGLADELRTQGRPTKADEMLLEAIGSRIKAIAELHGGLPEPTSRLDSDLLSRAGITDVRPSTRTLSQSDALQAKAHNVSLAQLLREWAKRTEPASKSQADVYKGIVALLDPPADGIDVDALGGEKRMLARLAREKLSLDEVLARTSAPLRVQGAILDDAFYAIWDWYWELRGQGESTLEAREKATAAAKKLAEWLGEPRTRLNALRLEAVLLSDRGKAADAEAALRAAKLLIQRGPEMLHHTLHNAATVAERAGGTAKLAVFRQRADNAKLLGGRMLGEALYDLSYAAIGVDGSIGDSAKRQLEDLTASLEKSGNFEDAAWCLERLAWLANYAQHADGTSEAVSFFMRREEVLKKLDDPLRSLEARAGTLGAIADAYYHRYRNGAGKELDRTPAVTVLIGGIATEARRLAGGGQYREAVRIVSQLPTRPSGVEPLVHEALKWADRFEESAEHPNLSGRLHSMLASYGKDPAQRRQHRANSTAAYLRGNNLHQAAGQLQIALEGAPSNEDFAALFDQCLDIAKKETDYQAECAYGAVAYASWGKGLPPDLENRVADFGRRAPPLIDRRYRPPSRMTFRASWSAFLANSGDMAASRATNDYVRDYYQNVAQNAYMWATYLSHVGTKVKVSHPGYATELHEQFERAGGASDYWKASVYADYANTARLANNPTAEQMFLRVGRRAAELHRQYLYLYDHHPAKAALAKKDWAALAKSYEHTRSELAKRYPTYDLLIGEYDLVHAVALHLRKEQTASKRVIKLLIDPLKAEPTRRTPCWNAKAAAVAAAMAMARGECKAGAELREMALRARAACKAEQCYNTPAGVDWCDRPSMMIDQENECRKPFNAESVLF